MSRRGAWDFRLERYDQATVDARNPYSEGDPSATYRFRDVELPAGLDRKPRPFHASTLPTAVQTRLTAQFGFLSTTLAAELAEAATHAAIDVLVEQGVVAWRS